MYCVPSWQRLNRNSTFSESCLGSLMLSVSIIHAELCQPSGAKQSHLLPLFIQCISWQILLVLPSLSVDMCPMTLFVNVSECQRKRSEQWSHCVCVYALSCAAVSERKREKESKQNQEHLNEWMCTAMKKDLIHFKFIWRLQVLCPILKATFIRGGSLPRIYSMSVTKLTIYMLVAEFQ